MIRFNFSSKNESSHHAQDDQQSLGPIKRRVLSPFRRRHDHLELVDKHIRTEDLKNGNKLPSATPLITKEVLLDSRSKEKLAPTHRVLHSITNRTNRSKFVPQSRVSVA